MNNLHVSRVALGAALAGILATSVAAQDGAFSKQEQARLRFEALHETMQSLQVSLEETAPDESRVLALGNKFVQESRIREQMAEVKQLLAGSRWDEALEKMNGVRDQLQSLVKLLQNRDVDLEDLKQEIEKLERFAERVDELIDEQRKEKNEAADTQALQEHVENLERAAAALGELAKQQGELREQANAAGLAAAPEEAEALTEQEEQLAEEAQALAEDLQDLEQEQRELDSQRSQQSQGGEQQESGGASGESSEACQSASQSMGKAQEQLGQNKPESALEDMDRALEKLEQAKRAIEKMSEEARRQLQELPLDEQAEKQEATRAATDELAKEMEQGGDQKAGPDAEPGEQQEQAPGTKNVQQAVPKQKAAAGQLKERKPGEAKQEQQDALENLEKAQEELEDALAQLRQQLQDEVLRALEERFAAMLATQKELSARTLVTDRLGRESLTADGGLPAALVERCSELSEGELELASEAGDARKLLEEEGTTAVFPELVEEIEDDLGSVGGRLAKAQTGAATQAMQAEIEDTLETLLGALRRTIEENSEGGGGQCDGEPPLVPRSAELKLILALQKRVHQRTVEYDTSVPQAEREGDDARAEAGEVARKQGRVKELTRKLAVQINKEGEATENQ